jgi:hypothetical protein
MAKTVYFRLLENSDCRVINWIVRGRFTWVKDKNKPLQQFTQTDDNQLGGKWRAVRDVGQEVPPNDWRFLEEHFDLEAADPTSSGGINLYSAPQKKLLP